MSVTNFTGEFIRWVSKYKFVLLASLFFYILMHNLPFLIYRRGLTFILFLAIAFFYRKQIVTLFRETQGYYLRTTLYFLAFSLLIKVLPGGYFPPFFAAIAGWTVQVNPDNPIVVPGLKLIREDGQSIWYSNGLTLPQNFFTRQMKACNNASDDELKSCLRYFHHLYIYSFPYLQQGKFRSQRYLGNWFHPAHKPCRMYPYREFPPESIVGLEYVIEKYDPDKQTLLNQEKVYQYNIQDEALIRK
jgi:hypothetical protein